MKKNPNDKVGTYRLRAYPAAQPRDMMHENLPYRINQLNMRGLGTVIRRLISATILIAFIIFSFSVIIFATSMKTLIKENPAVYACASNHGASHIASLPFSHPHPSTPSLSRP